MFDIENIKILKEIINKKYDEGYDEGYKDGWASAIEFVKKEKE